MTRLTRFLPTLLLSVVAAALLILVAARGEVYGPHISDAVADSPPPTARAGLVPDSPPDDITTAMAPGDRRDFLERPVFMPQRTRPSEAADDAAEPAAPVVQTPRVTLIGLTQRGANRAALLRDDGGKLSWAYEGMAVEGWRIAAIAPAGVKLERKGQTVELALHDD